MTKDVLISIIGLHYDTASGAMPEEENEPIEVITPAIYYLKNERHYVLYDEVVEGISGGIRNKVKIIPGELLEITKTGLTNTKMTFEKGKIHMSEYATPYGELLVGVYTKKLTFQEEEQLIKTYVSYTLDINGEKVADCEITIKIRAKG